MTNGFLMRGTPFSLFFDEPLLGKFGKAWASGLVECFTVRHLLEGFAARTIGKCLTEIELAEDDLRLHALTKLRELATIEFAIRQTRTFTAALPFEAYRSDLVPQKFQVADSELTKMR